MSKKQNALLMLFLVISLIITIIAILMEVRK